MWCRTVHTVSCVIYLQLQTVINTIMLYIEQHVEQCRHIHISITSLFHHCNERYIKCTAGLGNSVLNDDIPENIFSP